MEVICKMKINIKDVHSNYWNDKIVIEIQNPISKSWIFVYCRCSQCGWPMCNEACSASPNHKPECQMTLARGHPMKIDIGNAAKPFPLYETVAIMRCLSLKITSPEKYKALLALEPHTEERKRNGRYVLHCNFSIQHTSIISLYHTYISYLYIISSYVKGMIETVRQWFGCFDSFSLSQKKIIVMTRSFISVEYYLSMLMNYQ